MHDNVPYLNPLGYEKPMSRIDWENYSQYFSNEILRLERILERAIFAKEFLSPITFQYSLKEPIRLHYPHVSCAQCANWITLDNFNDAILDFFYPKYLTYRIFCCEKCKLDWVSDGTASSENLVSDDLADEDLVSDDLNKPL